MVLFASCLALGVLLAQAFTVLALAPASLLIFVISFTVAETVETKLLTAGIAATALGHPPLSEPS